MKPLAVNASPEPKPEAAHRLRASNRRTALVLATIAAVFFFGIIGTQFLGARSTGIVVMSAAVLLFLVLAIGRNLSGKR